MPTIAQIIAAKKAAGKQVACFPAAQADPELEVAINRIDPPSVGKRRAGLVLSASTPYDPRSLSKPKGEAIPMTPANADKETSTWHEATNSFESSLCVMRDPNEPEVIWLAVRPDREGLPPILLHRLPWLLYDHPATIRPEDIPF